MAELFKILRSKWPTYVDMLFVPTVYCQPNMFLHAISPKGTGYMSIYVTPRTHYSRFLDARIWMM